MEGLLLCLLMVRSGFSSTVRNRSKNCDPSGRNGQRTTSVGGYRDMIAAQREVMIRLC